MAGHPSVFEESSGDSASTPVIAHDPAPAVGPDSLPQHPEPAQTRRLNIPPFEHARTAEYADIRLPTPVEKARAAAAAAKRAANPPPPGPTAEGVHKPYDEDDMEGNWKKETVI